MGFSNAFLIISSEGLFVKSETTKVETREYIIHIVPISGDVLTPSFSATERVQSQPFLSYPNTKIRTTVRTRAPITDVHTAGLLTFLQRSPRTKGPMKHPARVPQLIPIR